MRYEGSIYRPPSERNSLIIQATIGCAHNHCTFCSMYKEKTFRLRPLEDILFDLSEARKQYPTIKRIFLADGNSLVLKTDALIAVLKSIQSLFPECERVAAYAAPQDILRKSDDDLRLLRKLGLKILYMGIESGNDVLLSQVCKGATSTDMIQAGQKAKTAGMALSVTVISGIGGKKYWEQHATDSAHVLNAIDPDYLGLLTLMVEPRTPLYDDVQNKRFELLTPLEVLMETKKMVENLNLTHCLFRSNHPSNYVALSGQFPTDKARILNQIDDGLSETYDIRNEWTRRL